MQERLVRAIRYGILYAIGAATIGAALFSGCNQNNNPNTKKQDVAVRENVQYSAPKSDYETPKSNVEVLVDSEGKASSIPDGIEGPELFDPRTSMGLEQRVEVREPARQYETPAPATAVAPEPAPLQTAPTQNYQTAPVQRVQENLAPLPAAATTPAYQTPQEPLAQPVTPRTNDYQDPRRIQPREIIPRTNDYQAPAPLPAAATTPGYQTPSTTNYPSTNQSYQSQGVIPRTNSWNPNSSRDFQRTESGNRY